jgi:DNA-binding SARP family transcriptional activator/tetratricopeptide (TPR) repeat protein
MAELRILGPVQLWAAGREIDLGHNRQRTVLAALLVDVGRPVTTEQLIDRVWNENPPDGARSGLYSYVTRLRRALAQVADAAGRPRLLKRAGGYVLDTNPEQVDLYLFRRLVADARDVAVEDPVRVKLLDEAVQLWRDDPLAGLAGDWVARTRETLVQQRIDAIVLWAQARLRIGQPASVIGELRELVDRHRLAEPLIGCLVEALYRAERRAEALDCYARARQGLVEALGAEPGPPLRALHEMILRDEPGVHSAAPAAPGAAAWLIPAQLPPEAGGFTGRSEHLRLLDALLCASDDKPAESGTGVVVAVIAGSAGVGKTALAVRWAHRVRWRFPDGQLYVNLRGHAALPPLRPVDALAQFLPALGLPTNQVPTEAEAASAVYRSLLADKRMLVVLDDARTTDQVRPLVPASPGCLVLVTSRDALGGLVALDGAHRTTVDVMAPDEARQLLLRIVGTERIAAEADAAEALAAACAYLPLALRIVAAHLVDNPHRRIIDQVAELCAGDRLTALRIGQDEDTAVRAAFDLSYLNQPAGGRRLFRLLGLVPGPDITAEAAAALAGTSAAVAGRLLGALSGAHLLTEHRPGRYTFHDLLRAYAADHAGRADGETDTGAATRRLYQFYLRSVDNAMELIRPTALHLSREPTDDAAVPARFVDRSQALGWVNAELPNLVAAITVAARRGPRSAAWLLADALRGYWPLGIGHTEWFAVGQAARTASTAEGDLGGQAVAEMSLASAEYNHGRYHDAIGHHNRALTLVRRTGWSQWEATILNNLGNAYSRLGQLDVAIGSYHQSLEIRRRLGDLKGQAAALDNLGLIEYYLGRLDHAADLCSQAAALYQSNGSKADEALALGNVGEALHGLGHLPEARETLQRAIAIYDDAGRDRDTVDCLRVLALVECDLGNPTRARDLAQTALTLVHESGARQYLPYLLNALGSVYNRLGRHDDAITYHHRAVESAKEALNSAPEIDGLIGLATANLGTGQVDQANRYATTALTLARRTGYRLLEGQAGTALAATELDADRSEQAEDHARQALAIHLETGHRPGQAHTHLLLAQVCEHSHRPDAAQHHRRQAAALHADMGVPHHTRFITG